MKIEKKIYYIIKSFKFKHLVFLIVINTICFYLSFNHFSKKSDFINELTLEIKIPRYSRIEVGNFISIVRLEKIYAEFDTLAQNNFFNKKCKINSSKYDQHIFYYDEKKFISSFNGDIPLIVKIRYPNENIAIECAEAMIEIVKKNFESKRNELLNMLRGRLNLESQRKSDRDLAIKNFIVKLQEEIYSNNSPEFQTYLLQLFINDLREQFLKDVQTTLEIEYAQNQGLEIRSEIFIKKLKINNIVYQKVFIVNLIASFVFMIIFIFLRKKI